MSIWQLLGIVALMGCIGGAVNALISDNGFALPTRETAGGTSILRPGFLGNVLLGAIAAILFWGLYGPYAEVNVVGEDPRSDPEVAGATREETDDRFGETLSGLVAAIVVGVGGARVITAEVDKKLLRAAASEAAGGQASGDAAADIASTTPVEALRIAARL